MPNGNPENVENVDYAACAALDTPALRSARLLWAVELLRAGVTLFPLRQYSKRPMISRWQEAALPTEQQLRAWVSAGLNLGVLCGARSGGLHVVDFDRHAEYAAWSAGRRDALSTLEVATRNGMHLYYLLYEPMAHKRKLMRGSEPIGDVLTTGAYVVAPYSIHPSGAVYTPRTKYYSDEEASFIRRIRRVDDLGLPLPAPRQQAHVQAIYVHHQRGSGAVAARLEGIIRTLEAAQEGTRNNLLLWSACRAFDEGLDANAVENILLPVAMGIGLPESEARATIRSAERQERRAREEAPPPAAHRYAAPPARRRILTPQQRQAQRRRG